MELTETEKQILRQGEPLQFQDEVVAVITGNTSRYQILIRSDFGRKRASVGLTSNAS